MKKIFLTIRETAATGILPEYALRMRQKQGKLPCIMCGNKCMINYPLLVDQLDKECKSAANI